MVDPKKIVENTEWRSPQEIISLRGFLRRTCYYRIFVQNYTQIVSPLITLLKKYDFKYIKEVEACFKKMKTLMTSTLVLGTSDFKKTCILECDVSGIGIGSMLM